MDKYRITDLYIAGYLKAIGLSCEIETIWKRSYFIFPADARELVSDYMKVSDKDAHNVNASSLVNEIKQLKAFVNNV